METNQPVEFVIILTSLLILLHKTSSFTQLFETSILSQNIYSLPDQEQLLRRNDDGGEFESVSVGINVSIKIHTFHTKDLKLKNI